MTVPEPAPELAPDQAIAERYRQVADTFSGTVDGVRDWDAPTPVAEWRARDVVGHLVEWLPGLVSGGSSVIFQPIPDAASDPAEAWRELDRQVRAILEDPAKSAARHTNPHMGESSVAEMMDRFYTPDVFLHRWDLARATGQDHRLDPERVHDMFTGMTAMSEMIRGSGQFGDQQPVPDDADEQEQLMAFLGRDPRWSPPA
ncbi:TIGR03086 family metal-binding protein [Nostocoides jenkinsii]|nr:TIGR03086 family metal-binding protein [Tetrasphaera jenkinsii]